MRFIWGAFKYEPCLSVLPNLASIPFPYFQSYPEYMQQFQSNSFLEEVSLGERQCAIYPYPLQDGL